MDCLDTPDLELLILQSLATTLTADVSTKSDDGIEYLISGLPGNFSNDLSNEEVWSETNIHSVISYCHYAQALPVESSRLPDCLSILGRLCRDVHQGSNWNGPSTSEGRGVNTHNIDRIGQNLIQALIHMTAAGEDVAHEAVDLLCEFVERLQAGLTSSNEYQAATAVILLSSYHRVLLSAPFASMTPYILLRLINSINALASSSVTETIQGSLYNSDGGSPVSTSDRDGVIKSNPPETKGYPQIYTPSDILRRFSAMYMVNMVLQMEGSLLNQALVSVKSCYKRSTTSNAGTSCTMPSLTEEAVPNDICFETLTMRAASESAQAVYLSDIDAGAGKRALQNVASAAVQWWDEIMNGSGIGIGTGMLQRGSIDDTRVIGADNLENATMAAILKLLTLASLHAKQADDVQVTRLKLLLSDKTPSQNPGTLEMALSCIGILALNFSYLGASVIQNVRKFAVSLLPILEVEMAGTGTDVQGVMTATAKCLAICVKTMPNDDMVNSTLYSLLHTASHGTSLLDVTRAPSMKSTAITFLGAKRAREGTISQGKATDSTKMTGTSTINLVSRLAIEIDNQETYQVAITMLLQRLRGADSPTESSIVTNLVSLGLRAPESALSEVIAAFSAISRSSHPEDPRFSSNSVLAAQTSLAKGFLDSSLNASRSFLEELLSLFIDKGAQIQTQSMSRHVKESEKEVTCRSAELTSQLAAMLLPIDALLANPACQVEDVPNQELLSSFRNMWLLCTLLGLTNPTSPHMTEATTHALTRIAAKTPALVLEAERDFVSSVLEYNSIFRRDYAVAVTTRQRSTLSSVVPTIEREIRSLSLPMIVFLQTVHDLEVLRMQADRPSIHLRYFGNASINDSALARPLELISQKIIKTFLLHTSAAVLEHSMRGDTISEEVRSLLIATTHRYRKVRVMALQHLDTILTSFAALMCDREIVFVLLEILTLLRRSCEDTLTDEYSPIHQYVSDKMDLRLELTDDYAVRNGMVTQLYNHACRWLDLAIGRAPIEMQTILQKYLRKSRDTLLLDNVEMGAGVALKYAKAISRLDRQEAAMPDIGGWLPDSANLFASQFAAKNFYSGELSGARIVLNTGLNNLGQKAPLTSSTDELTAFRQQMAEAAANIQHKSGTLPVQSLRRILLRAVSVLSASPTIDRDILHYLVALPIRSFTALGIAAGVDAWTWLSSERPDVEVALSSEISDGWLWTIKNSRGLFNAELHSIGPFEKPIEYSPTTKSVMDHEMTLIKRSLQPHLLLTSVISSRFQAVKYREPGIMGATFRMLARSFAAHAQMSTHPLARELRFSLVLFALQVLASSKLEMISELKFRDAIYEATLSWFAVRPMWSFGSNRIQVQAEIMLLGEVLKAFHNDHVRGDHTVSSIPDRPPGFALPSYSSLRDYAFQHAERSRLVQLLIENEISRLSVWNSPAGASLRSSGMRDAMEATITAEQWPALVRRAWRISPAAAIHMGERFKVGPVQTEISRLVKLHPKAVIDVPEALHFLLGDQLEMAAVPSLKWLSLWAPAPPVTAVVYFQPRYRNNPLVLQYAMRTLEQYPVDLTFFFVPQVVQALRSDGAGYVERFVFETSKISQLFCHQIIWNMKANCFKDDAGEVPDPMKPQLERMVDMVVAALSGKARDFYDLEFGFFNEVTSISGKLKPFIKKTKQEKKAKIDEEMAKIEVSVGVYLPSNPDGVVIDLDRKSGRPLQSHAKAPFMATFKVRKERYDYDDDPTGNENEGLRKVNYDVWQAAIFKVGDDCRQDVLALQIIAMFKNVFLKAGLVLYLFPYRVTATAPGCGVIDVVPNATSRDEMGRAKINDLHGYFLDKYGASDTVTFQKARLNFIQSMAAYSVACYILQIKDRHNGNIMIDGPGGVKFEPNSFKLNHEMVSLMGGRDSQGFKMFSDLTIKAFLAIRPYADQLVDTVHLMLGTGLPSFKGEPTIKRLRDRFQLQLSERAAADYMAGIIKNAYENYRSVVYDEFQRLQNGIPY